MLRTVSPNISVITNFGCSEGCWYCVWRGHPLEGVSDPTDWPRLRSFLEAHQDKGKVSVSGGGDCLHHYSEHAEWWEQFFALCASLGMLVDVHSRTKFRNAAFWSRVNRCVCSSDILRDDVFYFDYLQRHTKLRIVHVATGMSSDAKISGYLDYAEETGCQFTIKELVGHDDGGRYLKLKERFAGRAFFLDAGDYNLYYFPDNTIGDDFMEPPIAGG